MGRRQQHPLHRFAGAIDSQIVFCTRLAPYLHEAQVEKGPRALDNALLAAGRFAIKVARCTSWASGRGRDSAIVEQLSWVDAMEKSLQACGTRYWTTVTEDALVLGYYLHAVPAYFRERSILKDIRANLDENITWAHITNLSRVLGTLDIFPIVAFGPLPTYEDTPEWIDPYIPPARSADQLVYVPREETVRRDLDLKRAAFDWFLGRIKREKLAVKKSKTMVQHSLREWRQEAEALMQSTSSCV